MHPLLLLYSLAVALFGIPTPSFAHENEALRGFSVDLIHRNSPLSPLSHGPKCGDKTYETGLETTANYTYLIRVKVGDDDEKFATLDTGSNMIWLNGEKCDGNACTTHTKLKPPTPKDDTLCHKCLLCPKCDKETCTKKNICPYKATYGDGFTTKGELTSGVFSFPCSNGIEQKFKEIWLGVSSYSNGPFTRNSAGIVGLGRGELSLLDQLKLKGRFPLKFSYCLPQHAESVSKLSFGDDVKISEGKSAKLLHSSEKDHPGYYVNLVSIHVNENKNKVGDEKNQKIMIDSGTTFTFLNEDLFKFFSESVKKEIGEHVETVNKIDDFDICYKHDENVKKNPTVKFDFEGMSNGGRVTVELKKENYLEEVRHENTNYLCLMVGQAGKDEPQILGSRAQMGFMVAFDITRQEVSFDPHDCDKKKLKALAFNITRQDQDDCGKQNVESLHSELND